MDSKFTYFVKIAANTIAGGESGSSSTIGSPQSSNSGPSSSSTKSSPTRYNIGSTISETEQKFAQPITRGPQNIPIKTNPVGNVTSSNININGVGGRGSHDAGLSMTRAGLWKGNNTVKFRGTSAIV